MHGLNGTQAPQKFTEKTIEGLLSGNIMPTNRISAELVEDVKDLKEKIIQHEQILQEAQSAVAESQNVIAQLIGAHNKTMTDLQKWYVRGLDEKAAEMLESGDLHDKDLDLCKSEAVKDG